VYEEHEDIGWAPQGWKYIIATVDGNVRMQVDARITKYEFNTDIPNSTFEFEFPVGTAVNDGRTGGRHIVREDDEIREVTRDELARGATYEDLLESESGQALLGNADSTSGDDKSLTRPQILWGIVIVLLVVLCAAFTIKHRAMNR